MNCCTDLLDGSPAAAAFARDGQRRVGEIEFYGHGGLDVEGVRAALPIREGDDFPESPDEILEQIGRLREAVEQTTGRPPTDVQAVCCDERGDGMIFIGLPGDSTKSIAFNPEPNGRARLTDEIVELYEQSMDALLGSVTSGAVEDDSKGYALSTDPILRAKQLAMRAYATRNERRLRRVLESSSDARQRGVAAQVLGYANRSDEQVAALVGASRDADDGVRNNAIRALIVLVVSDPKVAAQIPAPQFVEMLSSGMWSDRSKVSNLLGRVSGGRDPKLLGQLRAQALPPLIEIARWRDAGHAFAARLLLGRMAGIEETRLQRMLRDGQAEAIINAL